MISHNLGMNISEYINRAIDEKNQRFNLLDSQGEFLKLFEVVFKQVFEPYQKQLTLILNNNNFNLKLLVNQQNLFMKQLKIPQTKDELVNSYYEHPIIQLARDQALKEIRKNRGD